LKRRPLDYFRFFYSDTCHFGAREPTILGLKFFGMDRTLFGTDMPNDPEKDLGYIRATIKIIDNLDLEEAERQAIYEGNARRLLKLK
jgi:predicted TIM-barrel fold metal-dependent hydrolase